MTFSNPASNAKAAAAGYIASLLEILGDRDPLEVMRELVPGVRRATEGLSPEELRTPEAEGKWSIIEVVQHLADSELVLGFRMRMALAHDEPELAGFDQDLWASRLRYRDNKLEHALTELQQGRDATLRLVASLRPPEFQRFGRHAERGDESIARMIDLAAGHGLVHLRQIERIRAGVR